MGGWNLPGMSNDGYKQTSGGTPSARECKIF
jgi:hypothetical protein